VRCGERHSCSSLNPIRQVSGLAAAGVTSSLTGTPTVLTSGIAHTSSLRLHRGRMNCGFDKHFAMWTVKFICQERLFPPEIDGVFE
jgi:hypothetical protein